MSSAQTTRLYITSIESGQLGARLPERSLNIYYQNNHAGRQFLGMKCTLTFSKYFKGF